MSYERLVFISKCQFDNIIIDTVRSNCIYSVKIMRSFVAKYVENLKQLFLRTLLIILAKLAS